MAILYRGPPKIFGAGTEMDVFGLIGLVMNSGHSQTTIEVGNQEVLQSNEFCNSKWSTTFLHMRFLAWYSHFSIMESKFNDEQLRWQWR